MHLDEIGSIGHRAFVLVVSMREFFYDLIFVTITSL